MKDRIFIRGEKIYLRSLREEDIEGNYKYWFDDEEVCKGNSHHRFPETEQALKNYINECNTTINGLVLAIIDKKNSEHIGNVSLQNINYFNRSAEFAIIIGEKRYWGSGVGKETANLIVNHGFNSLNLNRIYFGTYVDNLGMIGIAKTLGFIEEGIRREADYKEGKYIDIVEFGILKNEFIKEER